MSDNQPIRHGMSDLAQAIRIFGYCLVVSTIVPTAIVVTYLNGQN